MPNYGVTVTKPITSSVKIDKEKRTVTFEEKCSWARRAFSTATKVTVRGQKVYIDSSSPTESKKMASWLRERFWYGYN